MNTTAAHKTLLVANKTAVVTGRHVNVEDAAKVLADLTHRSPHTTIKTIRKVMENGVATDNAIAEAAGIGVTEFRKPLRVLVAEAEAAREKAEKAVKDAAKAQAKADKLAAKAAEKLAKAQAKQAKVEAASTEQPELTLPA